MLIAKINPPAIKSLESTPFSTSTKNLEYMTALARPYVPGSSSTNFQIQFGSVNLNELGEIIGFNNELTSQLKMTSEELVTWGTDDSTLLSLISTKLGVSILETINTPGDNF
jgi:hypothetical protein